MKKQEGGFMKFLFLLVIVVGILFLVQDKDGVSYGQKLISLVRDTIANVEGKVMGTKATMQNHEDDLQKAINEYTGPEQK